MRLLTSRGGSPFSQGFPVGRLTNSTSTFVSSHYKVFSFSFLLARLMKTQLLSILSERDGNIKKMPMSLLFASVCFVPNHITTKVIISSNCDSFYYYCECRYISKKTGAFICHRCGTCGSWFDFKRKQGDLQGIL